jgi:hypothetical protein
MPQARQVFKRGWPVILIVIGLGILGGQVMVSMDQKDRPTEKSWIYRDGSLVCDIGERYLWLGQPDG